MFDEKIQEIRDNFPLDDIDKGWFALADLLSAIGYLASEYYKRHEHNPKFDFSNKRLGTDTSWSGSFDYSTYALAIGPNSNKMSAILSAGYEMKESASRPEIVNALGALKRAKAICEERIEMLEPAIEKLKKEI